MKSFNNYLLTHYPLLWNMRIHLVWPVILLLHLLFFIAGYMQIMYPESLNYYSLHAGEGTISLAVLSALLTGVLWLMFYFRNNAFKRFYPLPKGRLAAEAGLIFLTCLGLTTITASYQGGAYTHVRMLTASTNLRSEANITNLAQHFLPFDRTYFSSRSDCSYRDAGVRRYSDQSQTDAVVAEAAIDTLAMTEPATTFINADTFSYLHYCNSDVNVYSEAGIRSEQANDSIAKRWLINGRQDSVRMILADYLRLCKKYGAAYRFHPEEHVANVFGHVGFPVRYELMTNNYEPDPSSPEYANRLRYTDGPAFIENQTVSNAISATDTARRGWLDMPILLFFFYFSFGLALLIFSFRITALRTWFIAVIGANIWAAVFGVLLALVRLEHHMLLIFLMLAFAFLGVSVYLIGRRESKTRAGVLYLWSLWAFPAVIPALASWIERITSPASYYRDGVVGYVEEPAPVHDFIREHWLMISTGNVLLMVAVLLFLFIPLARKWQAMPEE